MRTGRQYTGPAVPDTYDPTWQTYTNLNPAQVAAFQAFPEDLAKYARTKRWQKEVVGELTLPTGDKIQVNETTRNKIAQLKQAFDNGTLTGAIDFVLPSGRTKLNAAGVNAVYAAVVRHVQGTYTALAGILDGIDAGTIKSRADIDPTL